MRWSPGLPHFAHEASHHPAAPWALILTPLLPVALPRPQCIREKMDVIDLEDESIDAGKPLPADAGRTWPLQACSVPALWHGQRPG